MDMEIEFELTENDCFDFEMFALKNVAAFKQRYRKGLLSDTTVAFSILFGLVAWIDKRLLVLWFVLLAGWALLYPLVYRRNYYRNIRKEIVERLAKRMFDGKAKITLGETGIVESTNMGQTRFPWEKVLKIDDLERSIYIHYEGCFHMIPKRFFSSPEEANRFYHKATYHVERAKNFGNEPATKPDAL